MSSTVLYCVRLNYRELYCDPVLLAAILRSSPSCRFSRGSSSLNRLYCTIDLVSLRDRSIKEQRVHLWSSSRCFCVHTILTDFYHVRAKDAHVHVRELENARVMNSQCRYSDPYYIAYPALHAQYSCLHARW